MTGHTPFAYIRAKTALDTVKTPSQVGRLLALNGSLKGLPYGPGEAQDIALAAYLAERFMIETNGSPK